MQLVVVSEALWCPGLKLTKDTELGSNETIKKDAPLQPCNRKEKQLNVQT
jgi:hypothetical protein